jgi:hypothetical protein
MHTRVRRQGALLTLGAPVHQRKEPRRVRIGAHLRAMHTHAHASYTHTCATHTHGVPYLHEALQQARDDVCVKEGEAVPSERTTPPQPEAVGPMSQSKFPLRKCAISPRPSQGS